MEKIESKYPHAIIPNTPTVKNSNHHLDYSFMVSRTMIGENIWNKTVLDLITYPNQPLENWLQEGNATCITIDFKEISTQYSLDSFVPIPQEIDISHLKFILTQLNPRERILLSEKIISITKDRSIFIESDWSSFKGGSTINQLRDFTIDVLSPKCDLFLGGNLFNEISGIVPGNIHEVHERKFSLPEGRYYNFAKLLIQVLHSLSPSLTMSQQEELDSITSLVNQEIATDKPERFTPPDIYAVEVRI